MRIGRSRVRPPSISASCVEWPSARSRSTRSSSTIALVTTIPMSIRKPISALSPIGRSVISSAGKAPIVASGRLNRMMNGVTSELKASDHHQVDEQDRDAHRGEQAAERLALLGRHAAELDLGARRDRAVGAQVVDDALDRDRRRAGVAARDLGLDRRRRRLVDPGDPALDVGLRRRRRPCRAATLTRRADGQRRGARRPSRGRRGRAGRRGRRDPRRRAGPGRAVCGVSAIGPRRRSGRRSSPTPIALFGSTRTWISGAALTRSLATFARPGSLLERGARRPRPSRRRRRRPRR